MAVRENIDPPERWWEAIWLPWVAAIAIMLAGPFTSLLSPKISPPWGAFISMVGLALPLGIEQLKSIKRFSKLKSDLLIALKAIEEKVQSAIPAVAPELRDSQACLKTAQRLVAPAAGLQRARHLFILRKAGSRMENRYRILFNSDSDNTNEHRRIELLGDIIRYSREKVIAYTYASPKSMIDFWDFEHNDMSRRYLDIHAMTVNGPLEAGERPSIERIFVIPKDVTAAIYSSRGDRNEVTKRQRRAYKILVGVIKRLQDIGMKESIYCLNEEDVVREFAQFYNYATQKELAVFQNRGFLIADDRFISRESISVADDRVAEELKKDPNNLSSAYAIFNAEEGELSSLRDNFKDMRSVRRCVSDSDLQEMLKRVQLYRD